MTILTRARSFPLRLPLFFRAGAGERWRRATSLAISRDSLSFARWNKLPVGTPLDMRFIVGHEPAAAEVACRGHVTELKAAEVHSATPTYAATIESYRLIQMAPSGFP